MEKPTLSEIRSDIKYKRDSLHLAHEDLKRQSDFWNKIIIFVSLGSSLFESFKMKMGWKEPALELFPIILSSCVAAISSLIKFKRYNEQQEVLVQSCTILTNTLNKARNSQQDVTDDLLHEYHHECTRTARNKSVSWRAQALSKSITKEPYRHHQEWRLLFWPDRTGKGRRKDNQLPKRERKRCIYW